MNKALIEGADKSYQEQRQAIAALRVERGEMFSKAVDELFIVAMHSQMLLMLTKPKEFDLTSALKSMLVDKYLVSILAMVSTLAKQAFGLTEAEILEATDVAKDMASKVMADAEAAAAILKAQATTH